MMQATIELTPSAAEKLRELRGDDPERAILRVYVAGKSCCRYQYGLAFDAKADESDAVSEVHGVRLAVDAESRPYTEGASIDWVETPDGSGFAVRGPRIEGAGCACGRQ